MKKINDNCWVSGFFLTIAVLFISVHCLSAQDKFTIKSDVKIKMSDGIQLSADLYLPETEGKFNTILIRTPYNKNNLADTGKHFANAGYAVLIQDVRGQGKSEGQFIPFTFERKDGLETLKWLDAQLWFNGKLGLWGISYLAYNSFMLLPEQHPSIKTFVNISGFADLEQSEMDC